MFWLHCAITLHPRYHCYPALYQKWSDQQLDGSASHPFSTTFSSPPAFKHDIPTFCLSSPTTGLQNHDLNQIDHRLMVSWISTKIQQIYRKVYVLEVLNSNAPTPESMPVSLSYPLNYPFKLIDSPTGESENPVAAKWEEKLLQRSRTPNTTALRTTALFIPSTLFYPLRRKIPAWEHELKQGLKLLKSPEFPLLPVK